MKKIAFTLAETLIVMGIIGVVAALTLPNLNSSTGEKEKVAKVKKIYQNLTDAFGRATVVYGPMNEWFNNGSPSDKSQKIGERITEFIKLSKNCGLNKNAGCFTSSNSNYLNGAQGSNLDALFMAGDTYKVITADGTSILFSRSDPIVYIDIDGPNKGTNTHGKDIFSFRIDIDNSELLPGGYNFNDTQLKSNCFAKGSGCTAWVINNGNMDYLKCPDKLSETVTFCK